MEGWGYADVLGFDGREAKIYLVVKNKDAGASSYVVYETNKEKGISGVTNVSENAFNLDEAEFSVKFDVANAMTQNGEPVPYPDGTYIFALSIDFDYNGTQKRVLYTFDSDYRLTVKDGQVEALRTPGSKPAATPTAEPEASPAATAEADSAA